MSDGWEQRHRIVSVSVADDGSVTADVDGAALVPGQGTWTRESFAALLDLATDCRRENAVVRVQESDGSVFTARVPAASRRGALAQDAEVQAVGFLPGEEVAVAVVVRDHIAAHDGSVHMQLRNMPCASLHGLLLVGRASGTLHIAGTS